MENYIDLKYREAMWKNKIPVKIDMAIEDINDVEKPPSFYYNIPRVGYISNIIKDIKINFENYFPLGSTIEDMWFELNKVPLKWQIPFGLLVDNITLGNYELPISLILHLRSFPENKLIRYKGMETLKFHYLNSLKEASTIKWGSSADVLNLPTNETLKLLNIIFNSGDKLMNEFYEITKRFEFKENEKLKKLPIKIVLNKTDIVLNKPFVLNESLLNDYENYSLENYLKEYFDSEFVDAIKQKMKILIHGVEVDLNLPLLFLYYNFAYMDHFLYITLAFKQ